MSDYWIGFAVGLGGPALGALTVQLIHWRNRRRREPRP